jgi:acetyl esterase/lipase
MKRWIASCVLGLCALTAAGGATAANAFADFAGFNHIVKPDVTYATASHVDLKLDLYLPRIKAGPKVPTLVYFHGGGWVDGSKERASLLLLPYLALGWAVVNVDYRLAGTAHAPAAVEDARCALHWVQRMADEYHLDRNAIVVAGDSAGGHLALMGAMLPPDSPYDRRCATPDNVRWSSGAQAPLRIAAVVNWFGITDVAALLDGPDARHFAIEWFGSAPDRTALAAAMSPMSHVRAGLPPVITIHGDKDPVVPVRQAEVLHAALTKAGVPNELVRIAGKKHGDFSLEDVTRANEAIRRFLAVQGLRPVR